MEQKSTSFWKSAITCGLYMGIAVIIYSVILYVLGQSFNKTLGYLAFIIYIVGIVWAQSNYRKLQGDVLTYGQGVGFATSMMLFAGIIYAIYMVLLYKVIDPDLYKQLLLYTQDATTQKLTARGMSQDQIDQAVAISRKFQTPVLIAIFSVISFVISGVIIGLIAAIFTKKNPALEPVE